MTASGESVTPRTVQSYRVGCCCWVPRARSPATFNAGSMTNTRKAMLRQIASDAFPMTPFLPPRARIEMRPVRMLSRSRSNDRGSSIMKARPPATPTTSAIIPTIDAPSEKPASFACHGAFSFAEVGSFGEAASTGGCRLSMCRSLIFTPPVKRVLDAKAAARNSGAKIDHPINSRTIAVCFGNATGASWC